eukprot:472691_1
MLTNNPLIRIRSQSKSSYSLLNQKQLDEKYTQEHIELVTESSQLVDTTRNNGSITSTFIEHKNVLKTEEYESVEEKQPSGLVSVEVVSTDLEPDRDDEDTVSRRFKYALNILQNDDINQKESKLNQFFEENNLDVNKIPFRDFKNKLVDFMHISDDQTFIQEITELYGTMRQYNEYNTLKNKLPKEAQHANTKDKNCGCDCNCCYSKTEFNVQIVNRRILSDKLILILSHEAEDSGRVNMYTLSNNVDSEDYSELKSSDIHPQQIEILESTYNITGTSQVLQGGDVLLEISFDGCIYGLNGLKACEVYKLLKYQETPFTLTFRRKEIKCCKSIRSCYTKKRSEHRADKNRKCYKCKTCLKGGFEKCAICLKHPTKKLSHWIVRILKLSLGIISKGSAILDAVTDIMLLYKAASNGAIVFTMILFITLLAPYILSYSSGVHIFLYRKTFQDVQLFTFKSLLLGMYLFPTGILYFILLDVVDVLLEVYKWFGYGCIGKIKTPKELIYIESSVAEYFGMSRMDWISFKKQKLIAQLFYETVPQVILQILLYFSIIEGKTLSGVTNRALIISICSAVFNCVMQMFRLIWESQAVQESFIQYALNSLTARYAWVPYKHKIEQINKYKTITSHNFEYKIKYDLPLVTRLTKCIEKKYDMAPLQIQHNHKTVEPTFGYVEYDFSNVTIKALTASIKNMTAPSDKKTSISITFAESLRLLDVRSVVSLMQ